MLPKGDAVRGTKAAAKITADCNYKTSGGAVVSDAVVSGQQKPDAEEFHRSLATNH
jgi:predicted acylesterase/phospholipase RssA